MALSHTEAQQILHRMIFVDGSAEDWVQDVWGLSPTLGETAARLVDVMAALTDSLSDEKLENLVQSLYQDQLED
ncbi:MAG: hypothetical protein VKJ09_10850 [Leptolyngbya sp.]|nr:hypothetical protein [Leptolyngbya sp.]